MPRLPRATSWTMLASAAVAGGCGGQAKDPQALSSWLSYDSVRRMATIKLILAYNGAYGGFNFNGDAKGEVAVVVPVGWRVTVRCANTRRDGRHSCAIVRGPGAIRPAIPGGSSPDPLRGLAAGRTASFSFSPRTPGVYRLASLVPNDERAGMWDVVEIVRVHRPTVILLRRPP